MAANQLKNGLFIRFDGAPYLVVEAQHYKPGKGGALVRTKLRNLKLGTMADKTFRGEETIEDIFVEEKKYEYLYNSGGEFHFMDKETYEQMVLSEKNIGDTRQFLKEGTEVSIISFEHQILTVRLPIFVNLKVMSAEPGLKGDTAKGGNKNAELETGAVVQVPLFINTGDVVTIDTRTGEYVGRAQA